MSTTKTGSGLRKYGCLKKRGGVSYRDNAVTVSIPASQTKGGTVRLWHPNGHGDQPLYNISAAVRVGGSSGGGAATVTAVRRIGFRHTALVTINDTNATEVRENASFWSHFILEIIFLPRQARDKHRESTQKSDVFLKVADAATRQDTGDFTMMFRVNGAAVYARGGSMIPMDLLNGRLSAEV
jgi:hypothetical protein